MDEDDLPSVFYNESEPQRYSCHVDKASTTGTSKTLMLMSEKEDVTFKNVLNIAARITLSIATDERLNPAT